MSDEIASLLVSNETDLQNHCCGNDSIDTLVKNSFASQVCRQRDTYKVVYEDQTLGFFSWYLASVSLEESDEEISEFYDEKPQFGVLYIKFIAVDSDVQNNGIGTTILGYIVKEARNLEKKWPVRLIIFDALRERIPWYEKRGFRVLLKTELESQSETVKMYLDLMTEDEHKVLKAYSEQIA